MTTQAHAIGLGGSEAYLEGMKTFYYITYCNFSDKSEAYLEGMKTRVALQHLERKCVGPKPTSKE